MRKKSLKWWMLLLLGGLFFCLQGATVYADQMNDGVGVTETDRSEGENANDKVEVKEVTTDVDQLYKNYKKNSFELMTNDYESMNPKKKLSYNVAGVMKNFVWSGVKMLGEFNASMVEFLFELDIISAIRAPIQNLTQKIADNMLSIAGTIGISFSAIMMAIKYAGEARMKQALRVFLMTILIFTGLSVLKDSGTNKNLFDVLFSLDSTVETAFVKVNPVLTPEEETNYETEEVTADKKVETAGKLIAARVFYSNVYEPYLLLNYGTTNVDTIREKKVKYAGKEYDRINLLLDNDLGTKTGEKIHDKVTEYEADKLKNKNIQYYNSWKNTAFALFYFVVNLIQTVVYFVLSMFRLIIGTMQLLLVPMLPFLLFLGLFLVTMNVFGNYAKVFGILTFLKGMTGFACILFSSFLSYGFQLSSTQDDPWKKILLIIVYLFAPLGIYLFRGFLGSLFTGRIGVRGALAFAGNPFGTEAKLRRDAKQRLKERKEARKAQKQKEKENARKRQERQRKRGGGSDVRMPQTTKQATRSAFRRESAQQPRHKAPNRMERMAQKARDLHDQAKQAEEQSQERMQRTAMEKQARKTADLLQRELQGNPSLRERSRKGASRSPYRNQGSAMVVPLANPKQKHKSYGQKHMPRTELNDRKRRQGQTSRRRKEALTPVTKTSSMKTRTVAGQKHAVQKPLRKGNVPRATGSTTPKSVRRPERVREHMSAVNRVTAQTKAPSTVSK
ncbi:CD3337/EF1877 family mobilome membrane protein, partial [Enterococcus faecium]|uniref:CD3337/EF1877 family mobilome membrane protein n=1 Tax=Enterococcus faecium TaxID=1352 RepID=UPI0034A19BBF